MARRAPLAPAWVMDWDQMTAIANHEIVSCLQNSALFMAAQTLRDQC
jgi:hypothetical protein